jgi:hypothetical protein
MRDQQIDVNTRSGSYDLERWPRNMDPRSAYVTSPPLFIRLFWRAAAPIEGLKEQMILPTGTWCRNAANRSDFPPVDIRDATNPGAGRPIAKRRLPRRVVGIGRAESAFHEHRSAFTLEKLQVKFRSFSGHDFVDGGKALRFG